MCVWQSYCPANSKALVLSFQLALAPGACLCTDASTMLCRAMLCSSCPTALACATRLLLGYPFDQF